MPLVRFADRVRSIASTGIDRLGISEPPVHLLDELHAFDSIVSWYGANRPEFREIGKDLRLPFTFHRAVPPPDSGVHATDFHLVQVGASPGAAARIPMQEQRGDFAVIHPFSSSPKKNWPFEKYRSVARNLQRSMPVEWCAGREDPPLEGARYIDDLYELARWLARARLYVGNDCGITHLAAAVGTPVLALFGPTDPAIWAPRGANVRVARWH